MSGDAARSNDDELLSEIDELKARMDRLMRGGSSTSNSALLTDPPKAAASPTVEAQPTPAPPPQRAPVRDLIGTDDSDSPTRVTGRPDAVAFPVENQDDESRPADKPADERPSSAPPSKPKSTPIGGSVISVDEDRGEKRPQVSSFDELGTAIESELARDASVPPASARKGPDLASRFGSTGEETDSEPSAKVVEQVVDDVVEDDDEVVRESTPRPEVREKPKQRSGPTITRRRPVGAVVAIWVFTAVTSGVLATLHFTGLI